ncbi:MAG: Dolichyl-phosphate-mannose-protein mannosyltransferase [Microgenomates group bacterium ADurb.Bin219]|nr:MAG: Dolichyl-phosphate-mannose-protein mannosyltransferase [Microgenomates group bacterium ADurb.Bin219]
MKNTKTLRLNFFSLILILLLACFLRFFRLNTNPPSPNWDEVSHGYNAYSILKTGRDEWGIRFPLIFRAYGDFKLPLYIYLTVPFVGLFGLNTYSVRLVSVFSGLGLVFLAYLITAKIAKSRGWGILAALLTAVSPWSLFLSRIAVEANLGAFFFAFGLYFLFCWQQDKPKTKNLVLTALFWGLSLHSYNSARILVPIFAVLILIFGLKRKKASQLIVPGLVLLIFFLPIIFQWFDQSAKARFDWVTLLDQGAINRIVEKRVNSKLPVLLPKILFNKVTFLGYFVVRNYLANFSPRYLFFRGGSHYQFSLPDHELLYLVSAPFLLLGVGFVLKRKEYSRIILPWLLLAFLPAAITRDSPHVLRTILILPLPMILITLGLKEIDDFLAGRSLFRGKLVTGVFILAVTVSFSRWWRDYFAVYPKTYSWAWQYGYKDAVSFVKENYEKYEKIFFTKKYGEPHEFIAFYFPWEPADFQSQKEGDYHANWYWVNALDKIVFVNDWEIGESLKLKMQSAKCGGLDKKCLLVTSPNNYPEGWNKIKTINFLDGKAAFEILESL